MSSLTAREFLASLTDQRYGLMPDVLASIRKVLASTQDVRLTTSWIGEGSHLFHVSLLGDCWDSPVLWLVAADDAEEAIVRAQKEHDGWSGEHSPSFARGDQEVYEIGKLL